MSGRIDLLFSVLLSIGLLTNFCLADDNLNNQPPPDSAHKLPSALDAGFQKELPVVEANLEEIAKSSELNLKFRNFYFNRDVQDATDPKAWAQAGSLEYKIGKIGGNFSLKAEYFGSYPLWAPDQNDRTKLLETGQNEIHVLGVLNPKAYFYDQTLSLYRQQYELPFLNSHDTRNIPNTFEGYTIGQSKNENPNFQYQAGYIATMKVRESSDFVSMTEIANASPKDHGTMLGGFRYFLLPEWDVGGLNLYTYDALNIAYGETTYKHTWSDSEDELQSAFSAQYGDERNTGTTLVRGDEFKTNMWGVQQATSYRSVILKTAYNGTDTGANFRSPFGSYAGYNSIMIEDFNRAGEQSYLIGLSYDFKRLGLDGATVATAFVKGLSAVDEFTKQSVPNRTETDVTLDYKIKEGLLKYLWLRFRCALMDQDGIGSTQDYRVIVNYQIPLLGSIDTVEK